MVTVQHSKIKNKIIHFKGHIKVVKGKFPLIKTIEKNNFLPVENFHLRRSASK